MRSLIASLLIAFSLASTAQELNCRVEVNASQIEGTNKSVFEALQNAVNEYVNTNKWTATQFSPNERIECSMFFTISEYNPSDGKMVGDLQIQAIRPVYNSSYTTTLINFRDTKIDFNYIENDLLVYNESQMENQLTQILNFYVYLILAVNFDSFSLHGGDPYFDKAATIVHQAQSSGESGWKAFENSKNRSAVLASFTDQSVRRIRELYYTYYMQGLDQMSVSPDKGRSSIDRSLDILTEIYRISPMSVGLSMFKDAKLDELVNIYSKSTAEERRHAFGLLSEIYPTEHDRLQKIKEPEK